MSSLNWKPKTAPGQGGLLPPLNQQAEKGVPELAGGLRPTAQGMGLLVRSGGVPRRQETAQGVSWCCPALRLRSMANYLRPNPRATRAPGPSGTEVWVAPPGKQPRPPEMPAEGKGNVERVVE